MRTVKLLSLLITCVFAVSPLAATAAAPSAAASSPAVSVKAKPLAATEYGVEDEKAAKIALGANDFAFRLSAQLVNAAGNDSFVCSPYSAWMPLAALVNAADKEAQPAIVRALGAGGITLSDINRASSRMLYDLTGEGDKQYYKDAEGGYKSPLQIANALFVDKKYTPNRAFAQTFADYYRGGVLSVDFASKSAVDTVNAWASKQTAGLIDPLVSELDPDTAAAIANAIYFSDRWREQFSESLTKEGVFKSPAGNVQAQFMNAQLDGNLYYEDSAVQATRLGFTTGGGMLIILPKTGSAARYLAGMTSESFDKIMNSNNFESVKLSLPRFKIETEVGNLSESLTALGVPLFERAALTGLTENGGPMILDDAMQKAMIEVDEKGTTAAAVTVMMAEETALLIPAPPKVMVCDRPFVFVLYGRTVDGGPQVLFTGVVNRP